MNTKPIKCLLAGMFLNQQPYQEKQEKYGNKKQIELVTSFNEGVCVKHQHHQHTHRHSSNVHQTQ